MSENEKGVQRCQKCGTPSHIGCECNSKGKNGISEETSSILYGDKGPTAEEKQALGTTLRDAHIKNSAEFIQRETGVNLADVGYEKLGKDFEDMIAKNPESEDMAMSFEVNDEVLAPDDPKISDEFIKAKVVEARGGHYILEVESSPDVYGHMICSEKELKEWNSN